jgi:hypothetical protein
MVLTTHRRLQLSSRVGLYMRWVRWWRGSVGSGPLHGLLEQWNATGGDKIFGCRPLPLVMGFVKRGYSLSRQERSLFLIHFEVCVQGLVLPVLWRCCPCGCPASKLKFLQLHASTL